MNKADYYFYLGEHGGLGPALRSDVMILNIDILNHYTMIYVTNSFCI
tara:strand:- start:239 stop:379 length:141 start_codon:yes stop_codon:yes gene_type:complete